MNSYCVENLNQIKNLLLELSNEHYIQKLNHLSGATIGQHVRHILEFYQSIMQTEITNVINYDRRKRAIEIEEQIDFALAVIEDINAFLNQNLNDKIFVLECNFGTEQKEAKSINTSLFRELAYCLEHSIHHQALVKVGLIELGKVNMIDSNFGLAPATIRHKNLCVQ